MDRIQSNGLARVGSFIRSNGAEQHDTRKKRQRGALGDPPRCLKLASEMLLKG